MGRRLALIVGLALLGSAVFAAVGLLLPRSFWPQPDAAPRQIALGTHTGIGVAGVDTFLGQPQRNGDCIVYRDGDGATMLPIWPPGWTARVGPRFTGVWGPDDPDDHAFNVISEFLEFHGEWVTVPYDELRLRLASVLPEACREFDLFLVAEVIQRS